MQAFKKNNRSFGLRAGVTASVALLAFGASACSRDAKRRAPPEDIPASISVPGASMTDGFAQSRFRQSVLVSAFSITTTPITVAQYRQCIALGACSRPAIKVGTCGDSLGIDGATYDADGADSLPVTCVRASQAKEYCDWVGGRLPRVTEWLLAARGPSVHPFPWGEDAPTCARTSRLRFAPQTAADACCTGDACDDLAMSSLSSVGQHAAGNAPSGLADALMTRAEVVDVDDGALAAACHSPAEGCIVAGWRPGEIGYALPLPQDGAGMELSPGIAAAGFRCAWDGGSQ